MKITDATWERRNLGVNTLEIELDENDNINELDEVLKSHIDKEYVVVKSSVNNLDYIWGLPQRGFTYIESQLSLEVTISDYNAPSYLKVMERSASLKILSEKEEVMLAMDRLAENVFDKDRISLDQNFSPKLAGGRYKNWVRDLIDKGQDFLELYIKDIPIGFFIAQPSHDDVGIAGLAGLYGEYKGKGFGLVLIKKGMDYIFTMGHKKIVTSVSSNNKDIVKIHLLLGFMIKDIHYVYVKHQ